MYNREYQKEYRQNNKEKIKEYRKKYGPGYYQKNKEKIRKKQQEYYQKNKEKNRKKYKEYRLKHREKWIEYNKKYRQKNKEQWFQIIKEQNRKIECEICGYNKCFGSIDFHHRDPNEKEYNICDLLQRSPTQRRIEIFKKEIDKCDILCKNCHFEIHFI